MRYFICFLLFITFVFSSCCVAGTLKFVFSDFPPFEYSENGIVTGINKEIIEEACKRINIKPIFLELPWKRALKYAEKGKADAVFSLFKNDERINKFYFPNENLNVVKMVLLVNHESDIEISNWGDLTGKKLGIFLGSSYGIKFDNDEKIIKHSTATNESLIRMQAARRVDITVIDERVAKFWSKKIGMENRFKILNFIVTEKPTYIAFSRVKEKNKNWAVLFSDALREMKDDGHIKRINKKYSF